MISAGSAISATPSAVLVEVGAHLRGCGGPPGRSRRSRRCRRAAEAVDRDMDAVGAVLRRPHHGQRAARIAGSLPLAAMLRQRRCEGASRRRRRARPRPTPPRPSRARTPRSSLSRQRVPVRQIGPRHDGGEAALRRVGALRQRAFPRRLGGGDEGDRAAVAVRLLDRRLGGGDAGSEIGRRVPAVVEHDEERPACRPSSSCRAAAPARRAPG